MSEPTPAELTRAAGIVTEVLPTIDDLTGEGWQLDDTPSERTTPGESLPTELPPGFPDRAVWADAEVTFVRNSGGSIVHAVAVAFSDRSAAGAAWSALADEGFARRFAASVVAEALPDAAGELLGPHMLPSQFAVERSGLRVSTHHARYSQAIDDRVLPISLDAAVLCVGTVVLVLWTAGSGGGDRSLWRHLVHRSELRIDSAVQS